MRKLRNEKKKATKTTYSKNYEFRVLRLRQIRQYFTLVPKYYEDLKMWRNKIQGCTFQEVRREHLEIKKD